jgi:hypothetical protein
MSVTTLAKMTAHIAEPIERCPSCGLLTHKCVCR